MTFRALDLFAGIGGFSRAVHWLGGETVAFVEWEAWNRRVLAKHWPHARFFGDIHDVGTDELSGLGRIDLITGGYPCQPFSVAGQRRGHDDPRHLWPEMRRVINAVRPSFILAENVNGHVSMGLDTVLAEMESDGYACRATVIPAASVNALHKRERVWIMAADANGGLGDRTDQAVRTGRDAADRIRATASCAVGVGTGCEEQRGTVTVRTQHAAAQHMGSAASVADTQGGSRVPGAHAHAIGDCGHARLEATGSGARLDQRSATPAVANAAIQPEQEPGHGTASERAGWSPRLESVERGNRQFGACHQGQASRPMDARADGLPAGLVRRPAARSAWDDPDMIRAMWADGSWEAELPRVVAEEAERRQKLQAAGNAIVSVVAYEILRVMLGVNDD